MFTIILDDRFELSFSSQNIFLFATSRLRQEMWIENKNKNNSWLDSSIDTESQTSK